ncbi:hypothetical protein SAMN03080615_00583 [Amphritea atlantica]|uniref:Uncharacterized protein n=1 Tax=Amphritea atlantica TaxID=355243 RepID=A0A1H9DJF5_9GAMM|nr:hypothetical protein SAMN03080615_00583 [Amphritea atlantica]
MKVKLFYLCFFLITGCTNSGSFESIQLSNRLECSKLPPSQYDECVNRYNKSYDQYERERKEAMGD